jgi:hypothetical protein
MEVSDSCYDHFTLKGKFTHFHWLGGGVGHGVDLDKVEVREISVLKMNGILIPQSIQ